jgi:replication factor C small subunit
MIKLRIKSIKKKDKCQVYDLTVDDNHNFFITDKQILTHNCDYLSPNAQAALRGVLEEYHETARFVLTCVTGDTKVLTPEGLKRIDSISENEAVGSFNQYLNSAKVKKSVANETLLIKTEHGYEVNVTADHRFFTLFGEKKATQLAINDTIPVYINQLFGNSFDAEQVDYKECFSTKDFGIWLKSKGVLTEQQKTFLIENKCFVFTPGHFEIFNYILNNDVANVNLVDIASQLVKTRASVRNLLGKLRKYIIKSGYTTTSNFEYVLDLEALKGDYLKFTDIISAQNLDISHINCFIKTAHTVEGIVGSLEFSQFNADLLLSMGRLVGFMEGDGHLSSTIHLAANNEQTLKRVHHDISKFVNVEYNCAKNGADSEGLCSYYNNKALKMLLEYVGVTPGNKTNAIRKVPSLAKYKLFFKGFLQGLYDSDGKTIKVLSDNKSVSPILLTQSIVSDEQIIYFNEISSYAKTHFGIELVASIKTSNSQSTFGGSPKQMHLYSGQSSQIKRFLESIGHYYDKKNNSDVLGYLQYKEQQTAYNFLTFPEWCSEFYGHGVINDRIVSIERTNKETEVYDCCLEEVHWYVTNGFMSHNCNYPNKVIPALHSRCQGFHIATVDQTEFTARVAEILISEGIVPELDTLDTYVKATYPDLRKCINTVQMNSRDGVLIAPNHADATGAADWKIAMVELFKAGKINDARKLLCGAVRPEEMEEVYRWLYTNIELFGNSEQQDSAVLIIKQGLVDHTLVADPEINLAAVLIRLSRLANQ